VTCLSQREESSSLKKGLNASFYNFNVTNNLIVIGNVNITDSLNVSGTTLLAINSGNVGIGTAIPNQKLVVIGRVNITQGLNVTGGLRVSELNAGSCDIKSDGDGNFYCGNDAGAGTDPAAWNFVNNDSLVLDNVSIIRGGNLASAIQNLTINRSISLNDYLTALSSFFNSFFGKDNESFRNNTDVTLKDLRVLKNDSINSSVINVLTLEHYTNSINTGTNGIGVSMIFKLSDNISESEVVANITALLTNTLNGSETSALTFSTRNTGGGLIERMRIYGDGGVSIPSGLGWSNITDYTSGCTSSQVQTTFGDILKCTSISITGRFGPTLLFGSLNLMKSINLQFVPGSIL